MLGSVGDLQAKSNTTTPNTARHNPKTSTIAATPTVPHHHTPYIQATPMPQSKETIGQSVNFMMQKRTSLEQPLAHQMHTLMEPQQIAEAAFQSLNTSNINQNSQLLEADLRNMKKQKAHASHRGKTIKHSRKPSVLKAANREGAKSKVSPAKHSEKKKKGVVQNVMQKIFSIDDTS